MWLKNKLICVSWLETVLGGHWHINGKSLHWLVLQNAIYTFTTFLNFFCCIFCCSRKQSAFAYRVGRYWWFWLERCRISRFQNSHPKHGQACSRRSHLGQLLRATDLFSHKKCSPLRQISHPHRYIIKSFINIFFFSFSILFIHT